MLTLFNTNNDGLYFYNYISNFYPAGVPGSLIKLVYPTTGQQSINDWLTNYAFSASERIASGANTFFYFSNVVGTPTENESCTGDCNTTNNYRFKTYLNQPYNIITTYNLGSNTINTQDSGSGAVTINNTTSGLTIYNNQNSEASDLSAFCVKSPTTLVLNGHHRKVLLGGLLSDYDYNSTLIIGWLHNGIYQTPYVTEFDRYNNCFLLELVDHKPNNYTHHYDGNTPQYKGTTSTFSLGGNNGIQYYPIACQSGSYTPGMFLTDFVVFDNDPQTNYRARGTIDNRVVCVGRGTFEVGQLYKVNNVFGRTGEEHWLCVCRKYPSSVTKAAWAPGAGSTYLKGGLWKPNELDFVLIRVWVEAD